MIVKKSAQQIAHRNSGEFAPSRGPRFIKNERRAQPGRRDVVEISDEARRLLAERNTTPLARSVRRADPDAASLVSIAEKGYDLERRARVELLRRETAAGTYDFDEAGKAAKAAERLAQVLAGSGE